MSRKKCNIFIQLYEYGCDKQTISSIPIYIYIHIYFDDFQYNNNRTERYRLRGAYMEEGCGIGAMRNIYIYEHPRSYMWKLPVFRLLICLASVKNRLDDQFNIITQSRCRHTDSTLTVIGTTHRFHLTPLSFWFRLRCAFIHSV